MDILDTIAPAQRKATSTFYSKVISLFGLSILSTGLGVYLGFHFLLVAFIQNPILMYAIFGAELILIFTSGKWSKTVPLNYGLFVLFTMLSGITIVPLIASFAAEFGGYAIIYRALFSTTVVFAGMGILGWTTRKSLIGLSGFLMAGLLTLLVVGILGIFIPWGNQMEIIYSGAGVLVFALFAMVDMNRLKYYHEDQYIMAAIQLYLDIFNLFVFILRLTGALGRD
ncbi:Bax inhibitor-1/YccA family protein [Patescibacteria group bacterium]|nr:Bax inhibitor-1/YccA family protein [Patescibacteria group bacterium]